MFLSNNGLYRSVLKRYIWFPRRVHWLHCWRCLLNADMYSHIMLDASTRWHYALLCLMHTSDFATQWDYAKKHSKPWLQNFCRIAASGNQGKVCSYKTNWSSLRLLMAARLKICKCWRTWSPESRQFHFFTLKHSVSLRLSRAGARAGRWSQQDHQVQRPPEGEKLLKMRRWCWRDRR